MLEDFWLCFVPWENVWLPRSNQVRAKVGWWEIKTNPVPSEIQQKPIILTLMTMISAFYEFLLKSKAAI